MKILYVHRTRATGVEAVHIGQIIRGLRQLGQDVGIVSPVGEVVEGLTPVPSATSGAPAAARPSALKRLLYRLVDHLPRVGFELLELAYNLKARRDGLARFPQGADGIYERYAIFGLAGARLARRWGVPHVIEINYTSMSPLVRPRSRLLAPLARALDRRLFRGATHLLAVSSYLRDHLIQDFGVDPARITVVPNAADPAVFDPALAGPSPIEGQGPVIGFVGGFYRWHGLDLLVEAFLRIAERHPAARLVLIGDGPMRGEIETLVRERGLVDRVLMPGRMPHARLVPYVARFDMGVMPDSNLYGSPMKIFEYMAMGVPVVAPDYAPLLDVVTDGMEGRIFRRRDVAHLADCLDGLLQDAELRRRMGAAARRAVVETHNWMNNATLSLHRLQEGARA